MNYNVAPLSDEGRGLKPFWTEYRKFRVNVAPLSDEGRGLKLDLTHGKAIKAR